MAEIAVHSKTKLGWAKTGQGMESSSEDEDAVVPGVNRAGPGNMRPKHRLRRSREARLKHQTPSNQPAAQPSVQPTMKPTAVEDVPSTTATTLSVQDLSQSLDERRLQPSGGGKRASVSLKDLCVEDKQRIANLIKELAKVGEEREKAREDLDKERRSYEQQILKLVEQQEQILQERQEVEKHLLECQQLLAQSQQLQHQTHPPPPPSSLPSLPLLIPSSAAPPPTLLPPSSHPPWGWPVGEGRSLDVNHSLFGNVGSPGRHPWAGEAEGYHHTNHQAPSTTTIPTSMHSQPPSIPFPHSAPYNPPPRGDPAPHQHSNHLQQHSKQRHRSPHQQHSNQPHQTPHHYPSHPDEHPSHTHKEQSPVDFFAKAMQRPEPFDVFTSKDTHLPLQSSKEEVIERFFASQPVEEEVDLMSPKRRSSDGQKSSKTKSSKHGGFLKPVMSSTQKSTEIRGYLSMDSQHGYAPLVPDESSTKSLSDVDGDGDCGGGRREEERRDVANRVMFSEGGNGELHKHSPFGDSGDDPHAYRKMSQTQRKEQLLQQRTQLLEEQQRLKHVLTEQENMLREKQQALQTRSRQHQHHHHRAHDAEDNGNDPEVEAEDPLGLVPQRLAIDAALERQRAIVDSLELEARQRNSFSKPTSTTNNNVTTTTAPTTTTSANPPKKQGRERQEKEGRREKERRRGKKEGGETFVVATNPLSDIVCKLDYSLHSDSEEKLEDMENSEEECNEDDGEEEEETAREEEEDIPPSTPEKQDVGTSVSYRTIPRSSLNPREIAPVDRRIQTDLPLSTSHPPPTRTSISPGEKTMSVLEIINSLPSPRTTVITHKSQNLFSHPHADLPPFSHWHENKGGDDDVEIVVMDSSEDEEEVDYDENEDVDVGNEALEESQILEDIFFLK